MKYMAISQEDRDMFVQVLDTFKEKPQAASVVLKVLVTFLQKTTPVKIELQDNVRELLEKHLYREDNPVVFEELKKFWGIMVSVAQEEEIAKTYTTGQLARFFGVSITTINKWIASGRLLGAERTVRNKQARISEHTIWVSPTGEQVPVREIVDRYVEKQSKEINTADMDDAQYNLLRIKEIVETINFYENRYGGTYEEVVREKGDPFTSDDWQWGREGKEWNNLLKDIGDI